MGSSCTKIYLQFLGWGFIEPHWLSSLCSVVFFEWVMSKSNQPIKACQPSSRHRMIREFLSWYGLFPLYSAPPSILCSHPQCSREVFPPSPTNTSFTNDITSNTSLRTNLLKSEFRPTWLRSFLSELYLSNSTNVLKTHRPPSWCFRSSLHREASLLQHFPMFHLPRSAQLHHAPSRPSFIPSSLTAHSPTY
jgi:hypothetical protein